MINNIILETRNITKYFGGIRALNNVSIKIRKGSITGIIGPNGAGKTTLFRVIAGFLKPTKGEVLLESKRIDGKPPHIVASMGVGFTFQVPQGFPSLSVLDNVIAAIGWRFYRGMGFIKRRTKSDIIGEAYKIIKKVGLEDYVERKAGELPLGLQKRLEIARALALDPKILMLDEPVAGMSAEEAMELAGLVRELNRGGLTVMLIEHNVPIAVELSDYMYVLHYGEVLAEGKPEEVTSDRRVIEAYLGAGYASG